MKPTEDLIRKARACAHDGFKKEYMLGLTDRLADALSTQAQATATEEIRAVRSECERIGKEMQAVAPHGSRARWARELLALAAAPEKGG